MFQSVFANYTHAEADRKIQFPKQCSLNCDRVRSICVTTLNHDTCRLDDLKSDINTCLQKDPFGPHIRIVGMTNPSRAGLNLAENQNRNHPLIFSIFELGDRHSGPCLGDLWVDGH